MLIGRTGCGKTTLTQKLMNEEVKYKTTKLIFNHTEISSIKEMMNLNY